MNLSVGHLSREGTKNDEWVPQTTSGATCLSFFPFSHHLDSPVSRSSCLVPELIVVTLLYSSNLVEQ